MVVRTGRRRRRALNEGNLRSGRHGLNAAPGRRSHSLLPGREPACRAGCTACGIFAGPATTTQPPSPAQRLIPVALEQAAVTRAEAAVAVHLPTVSGRPAPTLPARAFVRPLRAHQVVGFLPYWEVGSYKPDFQSLTTLAYWAVGLDANRRQYRRERIGLFDAGKFRVRARRRPGSCGGRPRPADNLLRQPFCSTRSPQVRQELGLC